MFCVIYRWFISRSQDTQKPLPSMARRHLHHCSTCQAFHSATGVLSQKLEQDSAALLKENTIEDEQSLTLNEKIIAALDREIEKNPIKPNRVFTMAPRPSTVSTRLSRVPVPLLAAAMLFLVLALGIGIQQFIPGIFTGNKSTTELFKGLDSFGLSMNLDVSPNTINSLADGVETPMQTEITELKKTVKSGADFLLSCLDVNFEPEG